MSLHRARGATVRLSFDRFEDRTVPSISSPIPANAIAIAAPSGNTPIVWIVDPIYRTDVGSVLAFEASYTGGIRATLGDVTGDKVPDLVVVAEAGSARVRMFDGVDGRVLADFFAYEPSFRGGLNVAVGDVDADGRGDVILGTGDTGGPRVRVLSGADLGKTVLQDYFAYEPSFRGGVTVAAGDVDGDGDADVITGTGVGAPRVEVFNQDGVATQNFFAFADGFRGGVPVVAADLDGDGKAEIVAVSGPGGPAEVATFAAANGGEELGRVIAADVDFNGGVSVGATDVDGSGNQEIVLTTRSGNVARVEFLSGLAGTLAGVIERSFHTPLIGASGFTVSESAAGSVVAKFTVTLSEVADKPVTVHYATANGTATADADYVPTSGSLTFEPGVTSLIVPVTIVGDRVAEGDETVLLNLSNPTNGIVATAAATGTITDNGVTT